MNVSRLKPFPQIDIFSLWRVARSEPIYHRLISTLNMRRFNEIKDRYRNMDESSRRERGGLKYLNISKYLREQIRLALRLGLDRLPHQSVLDIGSGAGYFLLACRYFGHDRLGLDDDVVTLFGELMNLFELPRVVHSIKPFQPLPPLPTKFDLISAYALQFNSQSRGVFWSEAEWKYLIDDLRGRLNPGGRLFLAFSNDKALEGGVRSYLCTGTGFAVEQPHRNSFLFVNVDG